MDKIKRKETKYIIIHSSETTPSENLNSKDLNKLHRQKGFLNVKYHFIITRDGEVEEGRDMEEIGAHTEGYNDISVSVCLIGGVAVDSEVEPRINYTSRQWYELKKYVMYLRYVYSDATVLGFNEIETTQRSPYFDVQSWLDF